jgi:hypothetical protein
MARSAQATELLVDPGRFSEALRHGRLSMEVVDELLDRWVA